MIIIQKISKEEIEKKDYPYILKDENSNAYGIIIINHRGYSLGWNSISIMPTLITLSDYNVYLVGIDQNVVGIDIKTGDIKFSIGLTDMFSYQRSFLL